MSFVWRFFIVTILTLGIWLTLPPPVYCQQAQAQGSQPALVQPVEQVYRADQIQLAQDAREAGPVRTFLPTDITPVADDQGTALMNPDMQFRLFQKLPRRMWFTSSTEISQRVESNVFFTQQPYSADYVFRTLPNVTLGYNLLEHTSVYCNYFVLKDVFAVHHILTQPTTQSLSLGFRQDVPLGRLTNVQVDFQARELWQAKHLRQGDLLPSITLTRVLNPNVVLFASALLQRRSKGFFNGATRELDPFYTLGFLFRRGQWSFVITDTLVNNFRNREAIPPISNSLNIMTLELSRPVSSRFPSLVSFVRAEPIWNWGAQGTPGLSGFDFRLYGGIRLTMNKPSYAASVGKLRRQLEEALEDEKAIPTQQKKGSHNQLTPTALTPLAPMPLTSMHLQAVN